MNEPAITKPVPDDEDIDVALVEHLLTLTPAERIERHEAALELVRALRRAGTEHYGFDPRSVVATSRGSSDRPPPVRA